MKRHCGGIECCFLKRWALRDDFGTSKGESENENAECEYA